MKDPFRPSPRPPRFRPLHFLALFLLLGLSTYPLITTRSSLLNPFLIPDTNAIDSVVPSSCNRTDFNPTILSISQIDLGETVMAKEASIMLDDAWKPSLSQSVWDLIGKKDTSRLQAVRLHYAKTGVRLPMQLTSPKYAPYWPQFRKSLHRWVERKRYDAGIMSLLLRLVKDPIDRYYVKNGGGNVEELIKPYKTCAVVGNSGILLNQSYASIIDSHEMVMRLNNARIVGFERHVGFKTTLSFINSNVLQSCARYRRCSCRPYGSNVPIVLYICQVVHFMEIAFCSALEEAPIVVTDPRLDVLCTRIAKYYSIKHFGETTGKRPEDWSDAHDGPMFHYSSGMQAIVLALGICEEVSIFGFGKSPGTKHHYHTNQREELHLHDYAAEYKFYHDLVHNRSSFIPFLSESGYTLPQVQIYT